MAHLIEPEKYLTPDNAEAQTREWLGLVSDTNRRARLRAGRAALLVIDMQRYFLEPPETAPVPSGPVLVERLGRLAAAFRRHERPVIFTRHGHHCRQDMGLLASWWSDAVTEGSPESEIVPSLKPGPGEPIIAKRRYSAFCGTELELLLRGYGVADLVIGGVMTNLCCETTARDAFMRDFRVFFLADGTGAANEAMHRASILNLAYGFARIVSTCQVLAMLDGGRVRRGRHGDSIAL